jgi:hypothetical protein
MIFPECSGGRAVSRVLFFEQAQCSSRASLAQECSLKECSLHSLIKPEQSSLFPELWKERELSLFECSGLLKECKECFFKEHSLSKPYVCILSISISILYILYIYICVCV